MVNTAPKKENKWLSALHTSSILWFSSKLSYFSTCSTRYQWVEGSFSLGLSSLCFGLEELQGAGWAPGIAMAGFSCGMWHTFKRHKKESFVVFHAAKVICLQVNYRAMNRSSPFSVPQFLYDFECICHCSWGALGRSDFLLWKYHFKK